MWAITGQFTAHATLHSFPQPTGDSFLIEVGSDYQPHEQTSLLAATNVGCLTLSAEDCW